MDMSTIACWKETRGLNPELPEVIAAEGCEFIIDGHLCPSLDFSTSPDRCVFLQHNLANTPAPGKPLVFGQEALDVTLAHPDLTVIGG